MTIRFLTSGESHGKCLNAIIEGIGYGYELDFDFINNELKNRQQGRGRGGRMKIETDKIEIKSGVRFNKTTGSPICIEINNRDFANWQIPMSISKFDFEKLNEDEKNPLLNRFTKAWSPGSTFKPVTGAIAITEGKINPKEDFGRSGLSWQKDSSWGSYMVTTLTPYNEPANMQNALIRSDNIYFAKVALKLGYNKFMEGLNKLGFNEDINFEIGTTKSTYDTDGKITDEVQLADSGYGQGQILVNPIHMASIYSAFVNNGNMIKPTIIYEEDKKVEYLKENAISQEAANTIKEDLIQVVESPMVLHMMQK